jgi:ribonucleoside-diphosphate reductase alpha chain
MVRIKVKKRSGKVVGFDPAKIKIGVVKASASANEAVLDEEIKRLLSEITNEARKIAIERNNLIDVDAIEDIVERSLMKSGFFKTAKEFIVYRHTHAKVREVKEVHDDWGVSINAMEILKERYLQDNETPLGLLMRVARFFGRDKKDKDRFYEMFVNKRGISASPSLFNAGTPLHMFSPCFTIGFKEDSLPSICNTFTDAVIIESKGGGIGFNLSNLREKGGKVSTSGGVSSGILSWLKLFDFGSSQISQGGRRRGANMAVLNCMPGLNDVHPELLDFISIKMRENISTFNLSMLVDNYFMNSLEDNDLIPLISPHTQKVARQIPAQEVFNLIALGAHATGDPGMLFYDRINEDNFYSPDGKDLRTVNPCGEFCGIVGESCDLGSLNLAKYESDEQLSYDTETMTMLLNRIIDKNRMPFKYLQKAMLTTRKIGIGIMGFGDYCLLHNLVYGSEESLNELRRLLSIIKKSAISCSERLVENGVYPEIYEGRCNVNLLSIAPNGTISTLLGCTSGIEPPFGWLYERRILDGSVQLEENEVFKKRFPDLDAEIISEIKKNGSINNISEDVFSRQEKKVFRIAFEIPPAEHLAVQAAAQELVDLSISKTILLPEGASIDTVKNIYMEAWKKRCKGITIYRDRSKEDQPISWNFDLSCASGKCEL